MRKVQLNNRREINILGLGTYQMDQKDVSKAVSAAMDIGYRLYDTAQVYNNEKEVSAAIKETGIKREEVFITTKVATSNFGYERAKESVLESLKVMDQSYLDLVLIHWPGAKGIDPQSPQNKELRHGSYRALLELQKEGKIKSVGISNFMVPHVRGLLEEFDEKPQLNQVEMSPICYPKETVEYCQRNQIVIQAYSTLGRGLLMSEEWIEKHPVLQRLQKRGGISKAVLKWAMDKDCCVIPKSVTPSRIEDNFKALEFTLEEEDRYDLDNFPVEHRTCWDPNKIL